MRASNNAPLKLAHDISSKRCLCPKSNDLTCHTQRRRGHFCRLCQQLSVTICGVFAFILLFWLPRLCHLCHFAALPTRKYIRQPKERRAPYQLNNPYYLDFLDPLLLIVNIWNSRIANVFHLRRKLHFKQQGAMFPRAMASNYWKGKNQ